MSCFGDIFTCSFKEIIGTQSNVSNENSSPSYKPLLCLYPYECFNFNNIVIYNVWYGSKLPGAPPGYVLVTMK